jgi:Cu+-exporting ATPase
MFSFFFSDEINRLEQIIEAVLQSQTKRAPIERIVDVVTAYFVPVVTALAILTWIIWLSLGLSGTLPTSTLANTVGGWRTSFRYL